MLQIGDIKFNRFPLLLAPMEDVSDPPFRALCKEQGADIVYTEFISAQGLIRYADKSVEKLDIFDMERPVGIQIFGAELDAMKLATEIAEKANPDIIDINYGCPVKKVTCKMAGAGILQDIPRMVELTKAIVNQTKLPVTVKTRLGWDDSSKKIIEVTERLQDVGIQAISIHGRTRKQMYKGEADWTLIGEIKENPRVTIPVFGNGDIDTPQKALEYKNRYGVDGIMIGRASIGNPWVFRQMHEYIDNGIIIDPPTFHERVKAVKFHLDSSIEWKGEKRAVNEMKKHYGNYFQSLPGIKEYRKRLVTAPDAEAVYAIMEEMEDHYFSDKSISS